MCHSSRTLLLAIGASLLTTFAHAQYDPLAVPADGVEHRDLSVTDKRRSREIPIRVYLPGNRAPAATVLFSHGLGGSRQGNEFLGRHWAARGYLAVFLQHPGSDDSVWKDAPVRQRMAAMRKAASAENFLLRVKDVAIVLDRLEEWRSSDDHFLSGRIDTDRLGMSGHSFGAVTTQAVSGQVSVGRGFRDSRIKAAIIMSPSSPRLGDSRRAFAEVAIPWLLLTGTHDVSPIGNIELASRLAVFPALPPGGKYELILHKAEHSAFTDRPLPGDVQQRNPNHHKVLLAVTTAFWDAWLRNNKDARAWLDGDGPRKLLEPEDSWKMK